MVQWSLKRYVPLLVLFFVLAGSNSCKNDSNSVVPYVPVSMNINPTNYIEFNIPGGAVYFKDAGYGGVIVVNNWGDSVSPYLAFDATCTYEVSPDVRVEILENGSGTVTCPKCGSQFMIFGASGIPIKGPAARPLKQYSAISAGGRIIVSN